MKNTKNSTRTLTVLALLIAMSIVFSWVLSISTGFVRFNLGSLPVLLAALLFGPGAGFAVGAVADMIGGVLAGYAINPLITLGAGAIGLVAGLAWQKMPGLRIGLRLLLLPVVVSISYEINRWVGRHDNLCSRILSAPGKWLQRLTTNEPDDSMIECAIRALELVIPEQKGSDAW